MRRSRSIIFREEIQRERSSRIWLNSGLLLALLLAVSATSIVQAQEKSNLESRLELAYSYYFGPDQDYTKAYELFLENASDEYPETYFMLGLMRTRGVGIEIDNLEALSWYKKAADLGVVSAYSNIGMIYDEGRGVPVDDIEAVRWYRLGADAGEVSAQNNLGTMYDNGEGLEQNFEEAAFWYCSAAAQGAPDSLNNCGGMYLEGKGVPQNYELAADYYFEAAAEGLPKALLNLGYLYENGFGVPQSLETAADYYAAAAFGSNLDGADFVAQMYAEGRGVEQNDALYLVWHSIGEILRGAPLDGPLVRGTLIALEKDPDQTAFELFTEWIAFTSETNLEEAFGTWPPTF